MKLLHINRTIIILTVVYCLLIVGTVYCICSWITSGEAGKDIGGFAAEIEKGYKENTSEEE